MDDRAFLREYAERSSGAAAKRRPASSTREIKMRFSTSRREAASCCSRTKRRASWSSAPWWLHRRAPVESSLRKCFSGPCLPGFALAVMNFLVEANRPDQLLGVYRNARVRQQRRCASPFCRLLAADLSGQCDHPPDVAARHRTARHRADGGELRARGTDLSVGDPVRSLTHQKRHRFRRNLLRRRDFCRRPQ